MNVLRNGSTTMIVKGIDFKLLLLFLALPALGFGQDCSDPQQLCAEFPDGTTSIPGGNPLMYDCMDVQNTFVYQFSTNNNTFGPGSATIDVTGITCPSASGDEAVTGLIVEILDSNGDTCDPANWALVVSCETSTTDFSITTPNLDPGTDYFFILGNNQTAPIDCEMNVEISGPAVDIDVCCDESIALGESHTMTAEGGDIPPGYTWSPVSFLDDFSSQTVTSTPEETITYLATGVVGGCIVTDEVTILVLPPIQPFNAITPNGDGHNDTWAIPGIANFDNAAVTVYDRWGQLVFEDIGYAQEWDGTNNGKFLPTATYYYVIELNSFEVTIPEITGTITIIH